MNTTLLNQRSTVLVNLIRVTAPHYFDTNTNRGQKGLYETLIGAGIWYLPKGIILYSGKISRAALNSLENNFPYPKLVEEHSFPRKLGGKYLYEFHQNTNGGLSPEHFIKLYKNKLGRFNLVLKEENNRLKKFQRLTKEMTEGGSFLEFINDIEAHTYASAGIELCEFTAEQYKVYRRNRNRN